MTLEGVCCEETMWLGRDERLWCSWGCRSRGWKRQSEAIMMDALGVSNHPCCDGVMLPSTIKKSAQRALSAILLFRPFPRMILPIVHTWLFADTNAAIALRSLLFRFSKAPLIMGMIKSIMLGGNVACKLLMQKTLSRSFIHDRKPTENRPKMYLIYD
jgi:hypothetical protein